MQRRAGGGVMGCEGSCTAVARIGGCSCCPSRGCRGATAPHQQLTVMPCAHPPPPSLPSGARHQGPAAAGGGGRGRGGGAAGGVPGGGGGGGRGGGRQGSRQWKEGAGRGEAEFKEAPGGGVLRREVPRANGGRLLSTRRGAACFLPPQGGVAAAGSRQLPGAAGPCPPRPPRPPGLWRRQ